MNTAKHTPGPWNCVDPHVIRGPKNVVVAKTLDSKEGYEIKQANAHLIAAAPAMYEALRLLLGVDACHNKMIHCGECGYCKGMAALAQIERLTTAIRTNQQTEAYQHYKTEIAQTKRR